MRKLLIILFLLASGRLFAQTADIYEKAADGYLDDRNYQSAYDNYSQAIKKSGGKDKLKLSDLYYKRGRSSSGLDNNDAAMKDFNKAIELNSLNGGAFWERAIVYDKEQDFTHSLADYKKALLFMNQNDKPNIAILDCNIAYVEMQLNTLPAALQDATAAIAANENYSRAYQIRGNIYLLQQNYNGAVDDYTKALQSFTGDDKSSASYLYVRRGDAKTGLKEYKDAINDYVTALNLDPQNGVAYWNRGAAYHYNGDYKLAADDYTTAMSFYKNNNASLSRLYDDRATNELGQSMMADAIKDDSVAISLDSANRNAYYNRAVAYTQNGDYQAGINDYKKLVPFFKDEHKALALLYYQIANNEYFLNQFDAVIADCTKAIEADPGYSESYYYRAKVYLKKMNNKDLATKDFNKVMSLDSTKKTVGYIFALFYVGKADEAVTILNNEILATNNDAELLSDYYNMACLYALMNKADEANIYLKKAMDMGYAKKYAIADEDLDNIKNTADFKATIAGAAN